MCGVGREETRTHKTPTHTVVVVDDPHHVAAVFLGLNCDELVGVIHLHVLGNATVLGTAEGAPALNTAWQARRGRRANEYGHANKRESVCVKER